MQSPDLTVSPQSPLFLLAVDQRGWLSNALWGTQPTDTPTGERAKEMESIKTLVADGLTRSARPESGRAGILVDSEFGHEALRQVESHPEIAVSIPIEKNNRFPLELEADWEAMVDRYRPGLVKILVWHNPESESDALAVQLARLRTVFEQLHSRRESTLLEVLIPPTTAQLSSVGGSRDRYDAESLPDLMKTSMAQMYDADISPDVWKLEGMESEDDAMEVIGLAKERSTHDCHVLVLGRNASDAKLDRWLTVAARTGFSGFAIGRSIWWEPVSLWRKNAVSREKAVDLVSNRYSRFIDVFSNAQSR